MVKKKRAQNCQDKTVPEKQFQEVDHGQLNDSIYKEPILNHQMGRQRYLVRKNL